METPSEKLKAQPLLVFAIWDAKTEVFFQPFYARTRGEAIRSFSGLAQDPEHLFHQHPDDFHLYCLAEWEEDSGQFVNLTAPASLGSGREFIVE